MWEIYILYKIFILIFAAMAFLMSIICFIMLIILSVIFFISVFFENNNY